MVTLQSVILFLYNVDVRNFITKIWGETHLANHFQSKFNGIVGDARVVTPNMLVSFMKELDSENMEMLENYIRENH